MLQEKENLLGEANSFLEVLEQVSQLAQLNKPVLVIGERGTGKELIASRLHYLSPVGKGHSFLSTVRHSTRTCSTLSYLATRPVPLPARRNAIWDASSVPMAERYFWMS